MKISARYSAMLATIALATGIATGAAFFVFAHDGSQSVLDMCPFASSEATEESSFMAENGAAMEKMMDDIGEAHRRCRLTTMDSCARRREERRLNTIASNIATHDRMA